MMKAYIYDSQNTKIFVASSSASMLRDKKASLTGRAVSLEIRLMLCFRVLLKEQLN